jgi:hypothetical protein
MIPQDEPWRLSAYGRYHRLENHLGEVVFNCWNRLNSRSFLW